MATIDRLTAPTIGTRLPADRTVPGLEYGSQRGGRRFVRITGGRLWGLAREVLEEHVPDDLSIADELAAELAPWEWVPEGLLPAVVALVDDGGIRAVVEAEELREVLEGWAWDRLSERLAAMGAQPEGTLRGSAVRAALLASHRSLTTDQALDEVGTRVTRALDLLDQGEVAEAADLIHQARQVLEAAPVTRDETFWGIYERLRIGGTSLRSMVDLGQTPSRERLGPVIQLLEPSWPKLRELVEEAGTASSVAEKDAIPN